MERRNRKRLSMTAYCRISSLARRKKTAWKRIENVSPSGLLLVWSEGGSDPPPAVGDRFIAELPLPPHAVFGQRAMRFDVKVVRVVRQPDGRIIAGLETEKCRFTSLRGAKRAESPGSPWIN